MTLPDSEVLNSIVCRLFRVDEVTMGTRSRVISCATGANCCATRSRPTTSWPRPCAPTISPRSSASKTGARPSCWCAAPFTPNRARLGQHPPVRPDRLERAVCRGHLQLCRPRPERCPRPDLDTGHPPLGRLAVRRQPVGYPAGARVRALFRRAGARRGRLTAVFHPLPVLPIGDHGRFYSIEINP